MQAITPKLQARGFTVEFRQQPGAHEYTYWTAALKDALPWAAQKLSPASP
jgi:S-formylglutathione hydrolase FrmB